MTIVEKLRRAARALLQKIRHQLIGFRIYRRCLGLVRTVIARFEMVFAGRGKLVAVTVGDRDVWLRLGSTDFAVFEDIFLSGDYDWPFVEPPRTIVDAGAYTGISSVWFAQRFPEARIVAIEPNPRNFEVLLRNVRGIDRILPVEAALWSRDQTVQLEERESREDSFRTTSPDTSASDAASGVRGVTMERLLAETDTQKIDLLKVDIEGAEVEVFSAASSWIDRTEAICIELHDRFRPGCAGAFLSAVEDFPDRIGSGEYLLVARQGRLKTARQQTAADAH